jgi:hypothetical protein
MSPSSEGLAETEPVRPGGECEPGPQGIEPGASLLFRHDRVMTVRHGVAWAVRGRRRVPSPTVGPRLLDPNSADARRLGAARRRAKDEDGEHGDRDQNEAPQCFQRHWPECRPKSVGSPGGRRRPCPAARTEPRLVGGGPRLGPGSRALRRASLHEVVLAQREATDRVVRRPRCIGPDIPAAT